MDTGLRNMGSGFAPSGRPGMTGIFEQSTPSWPAPLAAVSGSMLVGFMPILALQLYAEGISAPSMLLWRYALALLPLAAAMAILRLDLVAACRAGAWRIALTGATLGAAQTLCFWESIKTLDTSIAVLLFYTYPALTVAIERLVFRRKVRLGAVACIAVILFGAALIAGPGLRAGTIDPRGLAWAVPSPVFYALYLSLTSTMLRHHPPLIGAGCLYLGMLATFGAATLFLGLDMPENSATWWLLLFIGFGPGALTITLFSYSVPKLGPSSYAIIANVELVTVVAVGVLLLGERVTASRAVGGVLIIGGILAHSLLQRRTPLPKAPSPPPGVEREGVRRGNPESPPIPTSPCRR